MSLLLAALLLYAYLRYIERRTETLLAAIAATTALVNVAVQGVAGPGASGIGASLLVCGLLVSLLTKVRERWDASH